MSITVNLTPTEEARLSDAAKQSGIAPEELATKLLRHHLTSQFLTPAEIVQAKLRQWQKETATETLSSTPIHDLFARWAEEDAQKTDEEIAADERLWEDFKQGIDEEREGTIRPMRPLDEY